MSLYDTENFMQTNCPLLKDNCLLVDASVFSSEIEDACQEMKNYDEVHYRTANKYAKRDGYSLKTRMDYILGVDDIMECELEDGTLLFVAIDWTDNPMKLDDKRNRFIARKSVMDKLQVDACLAVCLDNQVELTRKIDRAYFVSAALFEIMLKVEDMHTKNKYAGHLTLNMAKLAK